MRRFVGLLGLAVFGFTALPSLAQAQVIYVQPARYYAPPVVVAPSYYYAPPVVPAAVTYSSSYSYYGGPPVMTYSAPAPVVTYSAPAPVYYSPPGYYESRTTYGFGIFRPRGYSTQTYYWPY